MHPSACFHFCPRCGVPRQPVSQQPLLCPACGFTFYLNTTCATAALLVRPDGKALFIRRSREPARGMLAIPGGFVDEGETAEDGLRREFREEVGLEPQELTFLCSQPNRYLYKDLTYPVLDFFFMAHTVGTDQPQALDGVESWCWLDPLTVDPGEIAFPSMRAALECYRAHCVASRGPAN